MQKLLKAINLKSPIKESGFLRIIIGCLVTIILALPIIEELFKTKVTESVDIEAGVKLALDPLIKVINDHLGKIIIFIICSSAVIGEDGFTTRYVRFNKRTDKGSKQ